MTHVGQEGTARLVGRLSRLLGRNQRQPRSFDIADIALQDQHANRLAISIASGNRTAQQKPVPQVISRLEPAFHLEIALIALCLSSHARLQFLKIFRMNQSLPLRYRVIQFIGAIAEHALPVTPGFDVAATQIPIGQGIARKHALPVAQSGIGAVSGIHLIEQFFQPLGQSTLLRSTRRFDQLP